MDQKITTFIFSLIITLVCFVLILQINAVCYPADKYDQYSHFVQNTKGVCTIFYGLPLYFGNIISLSVIIFAITPKKYIKWSVLSVLASIILFETACYYSFFGRFN